MSRAKHLFLIGLVAISSAMCADDHPSGAAQLNYLQGTVAFRPAGGGDNDWVTADPNRPVKIGDRIWADADGRAELLVGSTAVRLDHNTGISFLKLADNSVQVQLSAGSMIVRLHSMGSSDSFEVDAPNLVFSLAQPGEYRVDVDPNTNVTVVTIREGEGQAAQNGHSYKVTVGQHATFTGADTLDFGLADAHVTRPTEFDRWAASRDSRADADSSASVSSASDSAARANPVDAPAWVSTRTATSASGNSIEVESWAEPKPGWLYVLDPRPDASEGGGHIWLLDPRTGGIMGSVRTGYHPDFALSPDGSRLYIASDTHVNSTELAVLNTSSGEALAGATIHGRAVPTILPPFSSMAVSGDGRSLRILAKKLNSVEFGLFTIDTESGVLLPGHVNVGHCGDGQFVSFPTADRVDFVCPTVKKVHLVRTDEASKELDNSYGEFPWNHKYGVATVFPSPDARYISIVRGDGAVFEMDAVNLSFYATAAHGGMPEQVSPSAWPKSPDGSKVYLGYGHSGVPNAIAKELRVYDTNTWRKVGTIKTSIPFWSAVASPDGAFVYALAPEQHSILVIDASTMREIRTIAVGAMPALALVAP